MSGLVVYVQDSHTALSNVINGDLQVCRCIITNTCNLTWDWTGFQSEFFCRVRAFFILGRSGRPTENRVWTLTRKTIGSRKQLRLGVTWLHASGGKPPGKFLELLTLKSLLRLLWDQVLQLVWQEHLCGTSSYHASILGHWLDSDISLVPRAHVSFVLTHISRHTLSLSSSKDRILACLKKKLTRPHFLLIDQTIMNT